MRVLRQEWDEASGAAKLGVAGFPTKSLSQAVGVNLSFGLFCLKKILPDRASQSFEKQNKTKHMELVCMIFFTAELWRLP